MPTSQKSDKLDVAISDLPEQRDSSLFFILSKKPPKIDRRVEVLEAAYRFILSEDWIQDPGDG